MSDLGPAVSLVIPCFNEAARLEPGLSAALAYFQEHITTPFEVIFVDDGSTDDTCAKLGDVRARHPRVSIEIVRYAPNRGKGHAVKQGVLTAKGEVLLVMDADFSIDVRETNVFLAQLATHDVVVGSKKHAGTHTDQHQKWLRRFLGKSFTVFTNWVLGLHVTDITCGLKGFRTPVAQALFRQQRIERWAYDAETLFLAKRQRVRVCELPVRWHHVEGSKVSPWSDTLSSAKDLLLIQCHDMMGRYRRTALPQHSRASVEV